MKVTYSIAVFALAGLAACSSSSGGGGKSGGGPEGVNTKVEKGSPVTPQQSAWLKETFKSASVTKATNFVLVNPNASDSERRKKEDEIAKATPEQKNLMSRLQASCKISQPVQEKYGDMERNPRAGAYQITTTNSSISGTACPVQESNSNSMTMKILSMQSSGENSSMTMELSGGSDTHTRIIDPDLQNLSGMISGDLQVSYSGSFSVDKESQTSFISGSGQGKAVLKNGTLQLKISIQAGGRTGNGSSLSTSRSDVEIEVLGSVVRVTTIEIQTNGATSKHFYVNGNEISEQELNELFGEQLNFAMSVN